MSETWRPVAGYEGFYSVSDQGRVRSEARQIVRSNGMVQTFKERILKVQPGPYGYPTVGLKLRGKGKTWAVHILVCTAFHGAKPSGKEVAHWNGNRADARAENLRWATPRENNGDKLRHGTLYCGERQHLAKLTAEAARAIRDSDDLQRVLAARYGVTQGNISAVQRGAAWKSA